MVCLILLSLLFINVYAEVYFKEEFTDNSWEQKWVASEHPSKEWGKFVLSPGKYYGDSKISIGIQTSEDAKFYGLSTKFEPFSNKDKTLVIQFSVKHEQDIQCGGGYLKIFDCNLKPKNFHPYFPYLIMFGPDICGPDKKVQVNFSYREKFFKIKRDIDWKDDRLTHLYTLIVKPDNTYAVKIDNKVERKGDLVEDWNFFPPRKIKDLKAVKPVDWDDNPEIEEPKPEDWDQPEYITDPNAVKLHDSEGIFDDWEPPLINNPVYKGDWKPVLRENPNYKGAWIHPLIDNPDFVEDPHLYKFDEICGVGFDIWQVNSGTVFDNILITDNELEAEEHGNETWGAIKKREKEMKIEFFYRDARNKAKTIHNIRDEL